ncbi:rhodanese-like domain-containing protein [Verrucomicrobiota bacterium sgz303538]
MRTIRIVLIASATLLLGFGAWLWWWSAYGMDLNSLERLVRRRFPRVRQMSSTALAEWLNTGEPQPVLLDARNSEEYAVSHLPGARNVVPGTSVATLEPTLPKDTPIVTYCSVGYRSSALAEQLRDAGYTNVQNLEGSIFRWANEDRPLVCDGKPTDKVHPYSNYWARLVKAERRASLTSDK